MREARALAEACYALQVMLAPHALGLQERLAEPDSVAAQTASFPPSLTPPPWRSWSPSMSLRGSVCISTAASSSRRGTSSRNSDVRLRVNGAWAHPDRWAARRRRGLASATPGAPVRRPLPARRSGLILPRERSAAAATSCARIRISAARKRCGRCAGTSSTRRGLHGADVADAASRFSRAIHERAAVDRWRDVAAIAVVWLTRLLRHRAPVVAAMERRVISVRGLDIRPESFPPTYRRRSPGAAR